MKFFLKRTSFLVIILLIITNFLLGNVVLAKGMKITDKDIGRIKTGLSLMKALVNYTIGDNTLKTALNITIRGGETGADITYGLVVLIAINEMDFIDMVVSQRYKQEATVYFDQVINERTNLMSYWKGVGYDLPRVVMGYITSPMAGLTLNSFSITDKIISIFTALNVIKTEKRYDGLWYYFSLRRENKMPHQEAWEDAKLLIGWAVTETELAGFYREKSRKSEKDQLESQFAALWDKWGSYTDSKGVTEIAKEQFREEMGQIVAEAIERQALAEKSKELSLLSKAVEASKNFIKNTARTVKDIAVDAFNTVKSTISQINPFGAGVGQPLTSFTLEDEEVEEVEPFAEFVTPQIKKEGVGGPRPLDDAQEQLDDIAERIDILDAETAKLFKEKGIEIGEKENELTEEEEIKKEEEIIEGDEEENEESEETLEELEVGQNIGQKLCEKITGVQPLRNKVIFNEIAWMGGINSSNDEWIEMRNISGSEIDLAGWQILSKSDNIKIVFSGGQTSVNATQLRVLSGGFFLLERMDDESASGAKADFIYTGALKNSEETIYLFDENCRFQDIVAAGSDWPAGDNSSKRTMERRQDFDWQTSANAGGTPKRENSSGYVVYTGGGASPPPPPPPPPPSPPAIPKILISEIQMDGLESPDDEFIELYNPNEEEVSLENWSIQRAPSSGTIYKKNFELSNTIPAKGYFLIVNKHANQTLLDLADMAHASFDITAGNTIFLVTNQEKIVSGGEETIIDKVGWWTAFSPEGNSAPGPLAGESIGRKWSITTESYIDTDNNSQDFEIQTPTPKTKNQSPEPATNELPIAQFSYVLENPIINQDILFDASSSTDPDGVITSFFWNLGDNATSTGTTTSYAFSSAGTSTITLLVMDDKGATSSISTLITIAEPKFAQNIIISEVRITEKEFVELYNPTDEPVSTTGWYLSYFSDNRDWNAPWRSPQFPTSTIPAKGYFLISLDEDSATTSEPIPDWQDSSIQLSNDSGAIGIFSCDPKIATTSTTTLEQAIIQVQNCKIDVLGWRESETSEEPLVKEAISTIAAGEGKSLTRKQITGQYVDNNNNSIDFEISTSTPVNSKGLPPESITDFQIASSVYNIVTLNWSAASDPDTLSENLSYKIYYSRNEELREENLNATSTLSTTTASTTIIISDLYYDSTYYFGVRAFDGWSYSPLSNTASTTLDSALTDSLWPMFAGNLQRNNQSQYLGPNATPTIDWIYAEGSNFSDSTYNPLYTPPIIRPEGTIFSSVIFPPTAKQGILVLNSDGSKKDFQSTTTDTSLILQPDGSVLEDDRNTRDEQGNLYLIQNATNTLLILNDTRGNEIWKKEFQFFCSTTTEGIIENEDNTISIFVKYNSCSDFSLSHDFSDFHLVLSPEGNIYFIVPANVYFPVREDYLYLFILSPDSKLIASFTIKGFNPSHPSVSSDGNVYFFYSISSGQLYLTAISFSGEILWTKQILSNYKPHVSPIIIDKQGNLYFVVGKDVFTCDKDGNEIFVFDEDDNKIQKPTICLGEEVPYDWYNGEIGIILGKDGTLYLSGRGAILGLK